LSAGPDIFMPTEFLHGLYDGGIGAGLRDYWNVMSASPTVAGGFFWAFADEGIRRTDQQGRIDNVGNSAPDGIVGPHGEKEGSYFAVKEIWSPVQIRDLRLTPEGLRMQLDNRYAFTNLTEVQLRWRALKLPDSSQPASGAKIVASGSSIGPDLEPGDKREWTLPLRLDRSSFDTLHLEAVDSSGRSLWTWSLDARPEHADTLAENVSSQVKVDGNVTTVRSAPYALSFDNGSGRLLEIRKNGKAYPLRDGPRVIAYRRTQRKFEEITSTNRLISFHAFDQPEHGVLAAAEYEGPLRRVTWSREADGIAMSYELAYEGPIDILGVGFALPEDQIVGKRWVGKGPFHVWQNRLEGGVLDVHDTAYNDSTPGQTYAYPEFKGYFNDWRWLTLQTRQGDVIVSNASNVPYFGLFKPQGGTQPILDLPDVGLAFLSVIPAMGTKFTTPEVLGPQSQTRIVTGVQRGRIVLDFQPATRR
ncbi:MAG: hypothetical protein ACJ8MR_20425, partial [Povalibacter sp.]